MRLAANAMMQPIGDMLTGDTQGCPVFHQPDIVDVGHLGTANSLINPAHHVAQNPLYVIIQLCLYLFRGQIFTCEQWNF